MAADGFAVGAVAVMDTHPRGPLSDSDMCSLRDFSALVSRELNRRSSAGDASSILSAIVQSAEDAITSIDPNNVILTWNPGAERLYGYSAAEVRGRLIDVIIPADRLKEARDMIGKAQQGQPTLRRETVRLHKDGTRRIVSLSMAAVKDADGKPIAVAAITHDITPLKLTEAMGLETEDRFKLAQEAAGLGIWDASVHSGSTICSEQWFRIYGLSASQSLHVEGLHGIVLNLRDISERVQYEEQLRTSHDQLRRLAARIESAHEEERVRISREVHDEFGQMLSVLKLDLENLAFQHRPAEPKRGVNSKSASPPWSETSTCPRTPSAGSPPRCAPLFSKISGSRRPYSGSSRSSRRAPEFVAAAGASVRTRVLPQNRRLPFSASFRKSSTTSCVTQRRQPWRLRLSPTPIGSPCASAITARALIRNSCPPRALSACLAYRNAPACTEGPSNGRAAGAAEPP
jgi:PAS domain S-box-containing protein